MQICQFAASSERPDFTLLQNQACVVQHPECIYVLQVARWICHQDSQRWQEGHPSWPDCSDSCLKSSLRSSLLRTHCWEGHQFCDCQKSPNIYLVLSMRCPCMYHLACLRNLQFCSGHVWNLGIVSDDLEFVSDDSDTLIRVWIPKFLPHKNWSDHPINTFSMSVRRLRVIVGGSDCHMSCLKLPCPTRQCLLVCNVGDEHSFDVVL